MLKESSPIIDNRFVEVMTSFAKIFVLIWTRLRIFGEASPDYSKCTEITSEVIANRATEKIDKYLDLCSESDVIVTLAHNLVYNDEYADLATDQEFLSNLKDNYSSLYIGEDSLLDSNLNRLKLDITRSINDLRKRELAIDNILEGMIDPKIVDSEDDSWTIVKPAISWAQARDAVFLNIKFSKHMNSPGASIPEDNVSVEVSDDNVSINAYHKELSKLYKVDVPLFARVLPASKQISIGSVGKFSITLEKEIPEQWTRLIDEDLWLGGKVNFWFDLAERYDYGELSYFTNRPPLVDNNPDEL